MFEVFVPSLMLLTGFSIGLAKIKYVLSGDLPDILTTLFLLMGWFQTSVYSVDCVESITSVTMIGGVLSAFLGISSLVLTGLSLFVIKLVGSKIQVDS